MERGIGGRALLALVMLPWLGACGARQETPARSFLMGSTPYSMRMGEAPAWRFEHMERRDLLSLHVDDFWGVPWEFCDASGCAGLPATWVASWQAFAASARATGKPLYLAVSPLGDRRTLARRVRADGSLQDHWVAAGAVDAAGCYRFATDAGATAWQAAYVGYLKWLVDLVGPAFLSPAVEMNMPFTACPDQKEAWIAWYAGVHAALAAAHPALPVFATFQQEHMYGIVDAASACAAGVGTEQCFAERLTEALAVPGDRIAFSTYPATWSVVGVARPTDTYAQVRRATARPIWISETGWPALPVRASYPHGAAGACGAEVVPASFANPADQAAYLAWLLEAAETHGFEAVVWWLDRDYLDGAIASSCPCAPAGSETCQLADLFFQAGEAVGPGGGATNEFILRIFGNMALHELDGTPRPARTTWDAWLERARR